MRWYLPCAVTGVLVVSFAAHAATFRAEPVSAVLQGELRSHNLWNAQCPVPLARLSLLHVAYFDFAGKSHDDGELMVMDVVAPAVLKIFQQLYAQKFPIDKMRLMTVYDGDDQRAMADDNTSAYNCRENSDGSGLPSLHAYGLAIDLNTIQNPWINPHDKMSGAADVRPAAGLAYLNRANQRPGMSEIVVPLFRANGFSIWGGNWNEPIDWQHFQTSRSVAALLVAMTPAHAAKFFALYQSAPAMLNQAVYKDDGIPLIALYQKSPEKFLQLFTANAARLAAVSPHDAVVWLQQKLHE